MTKSTPHLIPLELSDERRRTTSLTNAIEMMTERGYIKDDNKKMFAESVSKRQEEDVYKIKLDNAIIINKNEYVAKDFKYTDVYIKYIDQQISSMGKNSNLGMFLQKYVNSKKIIILDKISPKVRLTIEHQFPNTEIFTINELLTNKVDHILVPKHVLLNEEESNEVIAAYNARKKDMPKILKTDPIARYYNMPVGRVCKIIRNSEMSGECPYYRLVKDAHTEFETV